MYDGGSDVESRGMKLLQLFRSMVHRDRHLLERIQLYKYVM
jgi:hypothetical protein